MLCLTQHIVILLHYGVLIFLEQLLQDLILRHLSQNRHLID